VNLPELKQYLHIDYDEDDLMLQSFQGVAQEYIKNSVGAIDIENQLYKLAESLLVGHWYENREVTRIGNNSYDLPYSFESIIYQLKYCYPVGDTT